MKILIFLLLGLGLVHTLEAKKVEGRLISATDTVEVMLELPLSSFGLEIDYVKLQCKVTYYTSSGKKMVLKPGVVEEISFTYKSEHVRMLSRDDSFALPNSKAISSKVFLKLQVDGQVKVFNYFTSLFIAGSALPGSIKMGQTHENTFFVLQKNDGALKQAKAINFRKDMSTYFSDCPALVVMIDDYTFTKKDIAAIAAYYNAHCGN